MDSFVEHIAFPSRPGRFIIYLLAGLVLGTLALIAVPEAVVLIGNRWIAYGDKAAWYLTRATGTVAYLLLSASTIWGLILSSKIVKDVIPAALAMAMHSALSWLALGLAGFHAFILLFDHYYAYRLSDLLVPFSGPYRVGWVGLGTIGLYLTLLTTVSFGWRRWLGQHNWRRLHYLTFVAFALATAHGLAAGSDSAAPGMRAVYAASGLIVLFLTNYRLLSLPGKHRSRRQHQPG